MDMTVIIMMVTGMGDTTEDTPKTNFVQYNSLV